MLLSLATVALLYLVACFTPTFNAVAKVAPPRADLLLHLLVHAFLTICALPLLPPSLPPEVVALASIVGAFAIEAAQHILLTDRHADVGDMLAGMIGSFAVFLVPRDGQRTRPSWQALTTYLYAEEEDEDEDSHNVDSWAV